MCDVDELSSALNDFINTGDGLLASSSYLANDVNDFVLKHVGGMFDIVAAYCKLFARLHVLTRSNMNQLIQANYRHKSIQELHDKLENLEDRWNCFLEDVDQRLKADTQLVKHDLTDGDSGLLCKDIELINADDGSTTCLGNYLQRPWLIVVLLRHFA